MGGAELLEITRRIFGTSYCLPVCLFLGCVDLRPESAGGWTLSGCSSSTCARRPSFSLAQDLLVLPFWAFDYGLPLVGPDGRGCAQAALPPSFKEAPFDARSWRRITSSSITRPSRSLLVWLLAWDLCAAQVSRPAGFLGSGLRLSSDPAAFPEGGSGPRCLGDSAEGEARVVIFGCGDREVQAFRRYWQVQVRGEVPLCPLGDALASCVVPPVLRLCGWCPGVVRLPLPISIAVT
jgi:hypothetical protein